MIKSLTIIFVFGLLLACVEDKTLEGKRELVLSNEIGLEIDAELAQSQMTLSSAKPNVNWQQFMGTSNHNSLNGQVNFPEKNKGLAYIRWKEYTGLSEHRGNVNPLIDIGRELPKWRRKIGRAEETGILQAVQPVIFADTFYWMDKKFRVSARNLNQKGKKIWKITLPIPKKDRRTFGGGIAVNAEFLIVTTGAGRVYGLRRSDGSLLWQRNVQYPIHSAPSLDNGEVFFTTLNNSSFALNASTGVILWEHQDVPTRSRFIGSVTPAIGKDIVVTGYSTGEIVALNRSDGKLLWRRGLAAHSRIDALAQVTDITNGFVLDRGAVFAGSSSGKFAALDERNGGIIWEIPLTIHSPVASIGDYLFVLSDKSVLFCISKRSGKVRWTQPLQHWIEGAENYERIVWSGPVISVPYVIMNNSARDVQLFYIENGKPERQYKFGKGFYLSPISANGVMYFISSRSFLYAIK